MLTPPTSENYFRPPPITFRLPILLGYRSRFMDSKSHRLRPQHWKARSFKRRWRCVIKEVVKMNIVRRCSIWMGALNYWHRIHLTTPWLYLCRRMVLPQRPSRSIQPLESVTINWTLLSHHASCPHSFGRESSPLYRRLMVLPGQITKWQYNNNIPWVDLNTHNGQHLHHRLRRRPPIFMTIADVALESECEDNKVAGLNLSDKF